MQGYELQKVLAWYKSEDLSLYKHVLVLHSDRNLCLDFYDSIKESVPCTLQGRDSFIETEGCCIRFIRYSKGVLTGTGMSFDIVVNACHVERDDAMYALSRLRGESTVKKFVII